MTTTYSTICGARNSTNSTNSFNLTSSFGLDFEILCMRDLIFSDLEKESFITFEDCLDACSAKHSYGFTYSFDDQNCFCKSSQVTTIPATPVATDAAKWRTVCGRANLQQLQVPVNQTLCPYPNLSTQQASNGMGFKILCGTDSVLTDFDPWISKVPQRIMSDYGDGIHAENFTECIDMCAHSHPLCRGVGFAATEIGYVNCKLRNGTSQNRGAYPYAVQAAVLFDLPKISKPNCKKGSTITSLGGTSFVTFCNDFRPNNNISVSHELKFEDCVAKCATYENSACVGVMFDDGFEGGWDNCYLKSAIGPGETRSNYTLAVLSSVAGNVLEAVMMQAPKKEGFAWISGPIVGGVAFIVLVWMMWRHPKTRWWKKIPGRQQESSAPLMAPSAA
jgi:hypothetical protein